MARLEVKESSKKRGWLANRFSSIRKITPRAEVYFDLTSKRQVRKKNSNHTRINMHTRKAQENQFGQNQLLNEVHFNLKQIVTSKLSLCDYTA